MSDEIVTPESLGWKPIDTAPEVKGPAFWCDVLCLNKGGEWCSASAFRSGGKWYAACSFFKVGARPGFEWRQQEVQPLFWRESHPVPEDVSP